MFDKSVICYNNDTGEITGVYDFYNSISYPSPYIIIPKITPNNEFTTTHKIDVITKNIIQATPVNNNSISKAQLTILCGIIDLDTRLSRLENANKGGEK